MRTLVVALICIACNSGSTSKSQPPPPPLVERSTAATMLAQVPADSPYVMAMLEPVPELAKQQMFASADDKLQKMYRMSRAADRTNVERPLRALYAMLDELEGKDLDHWGRELGFDPSGRFVFYGVSVWPVLRIAVADETRVRAVIARMLAAAGVSSKQRTLRGRGYWQIDIDSVAVIASVAGGEAVFTVLPKGAVTEQLPYVLGFAKPARSLDVNGTLGELSKRYQFLSASVGFVDTRAIADILLGRASGSTSALDKPLRDALGPINAACRADIDRIAGLVQAIVFGYRDLGAHKLRITFGIELPPEVTASLQRLRTTVPELPVGVGSPAMFHVGVAAKLGEAVALVRSLTTHVREKPFACSWLAPLGKASAGLAQAVDQLSPELQALRGFVVVLDDLKLEPFDARGRAFVVGERADKSLALVLEALFAGAGVVVRPNGRPVRLRPADLGLPGSLTAFAAARGDRAAVAVGPASSTEVVGLLDREPPAQSPLVSLGMMTERMIAVGLLDPEDADGLRELVMQLDVGPHGLLIDMYGTTTAR